MMNAVPVYFEDALKAIKACMRELQNCPDIVVTRAHIGPKMTHAEQEPYARYYYKYSYDLLYLYKHANGLDIEWEFADGQAGGRLYIPALSEDVALENGSQPWLAGHPGPLPTAAAAPQWLSGLLDHMQLERGTWLVADGTVSSHKTHLVYWDQPGDVVEWLPFSLPEYLLRSAAHSFVRNWPRANAAGQTVLSRLHQLPVKVNLLQPGTRVGHQAASGPPYWGEVLQRWPMAALAPAYALVRFDLGQTLWVVGPRLKPVAKAPSMYELCHTDPWRLVRQGEAEGWGSAVRQMALLWGPFDGRGHGGYWDGSRTLLGLLLPLPLPEAVAWGQAIVAGLEAARGELPPQLELTEAERKQAHDPAEWRRLRWHDNWLGLVYPVLTALIGRIVLASATERAQVPVADIDRLEATNQTHYWGVPREFAHLRMVLQAKGSFMPLEPLTEFSVVPAYPELVAIAPG